MGLSDFGDPSSFTLEDIEYLIEQGEITREEAQEDIDIYGIIKEEENRIVVSELQQFAQANGINSEKMVRKENYNIVDISGDDRDINDTIYTGISESIATFGKISNIRLSLGKDDILYSTTGGVGVKAKGSLAALNRLIKKYSKNISDFSPIFRTIRDHFYETNKKYIFNQPAQLPPESKNHYEHLRPRTIKKKGFDTILVDSGKLRASLTTKDSAYSIQRATRTQLLIGTSLGYASSHMERKELKQNGEIIGLRPARPPLNFSAGDRLSLYISALNNFAFYGITDIGAV